MCCMRISTAKSAGSMSYNADSYARKKAEDAAVQGQSKCIQANIMLMDMNSMKPFIFSGTSSDVNSGRTAVSETVLSACTAVQCQVAT